MAYEKHNWINGEIIDADKLNHIENGIVDASNSLTSITNNTIHINDAQTLSSTQKEIIRTNIGINNITYLKDGPADGSLRASSADQNALMGSGAVAFGNNTIASAPQSMAIGSYTTASAPDSIAIGNNVITSAPNSSATGYFTQAAGYTSHAEGYATSAMGNYSHAEGYGVAAQGSYSHAEGYKVGTAGDYSHAEGYGLFYRIYLNGEANTTTYTLTTPLEISS